MIRKKSTIKEYFENIAHKRDYWKKKNDYYYNYLEKLISFSIPRGKRVLEIGCGTGDLLAKLAVSYGVGLDFSPKMISKAKAKYSLEHPNIKFFARDAEEGLGLEGQFDFIILSDLLGYLSDVEKLFKLIREVVHLQSKIIIVQYSQLWEPILELGSKTGLRMPHLLQNWLSAADIENILYLSDFEVIKKNGKLLLPKYIPLISRFFNGFLANIFPFNKLTLVNYLIARPMPIQNLGQEKPSVSIVVPARNEAGMIEKIINELPELGSKTEIIFVEGHSKDDTLEKIKTAAANYKGQKIIKFAVQNGKGKGDAVRKGFNISTGDILMIYDADMTVPPAELANFYSAIVERKGEFINGSRLVYPMEKESMRTLNYIANKFFSLMFSWLLGQKIKDTLCGTKVLWKKDYEEINKNRIFFGDFDPFGDFDLLFGAARLNLKIIDLPVHYRERTYGATNTNRWRHGWLLLKMMFFTMFFKEK